MSYTKATAFSQKCFQHRLEIIFFYNVGFLKVLHSILQLIFMMNVNAENRAPEEISIPNNAGSRTLSKVNEAIIVA